MRAVTERYKNVFVNSDQGLESLANDLRMSLLDCEADWPRSDVIIPRGDPLIRSFGPVRCMFQDIQHQHAHL